MKPVKGSFLIKPSTQINKCVVTKVGLQNFLNDIIEPKKGKRKKKKQDLSAKIQLSRPSSKNERKLERTFNSGRIHKNVPIRTQVAFSPDTVKEKKKKKVYNNLALKRKNSITKISRFQMRSNSGLHNKPKERSEYEETSLLSQKSEKNHIDDVASLAGQSNLKFDKKTKNAHYEQPDHSPINRAQSLNKNRNQFFSSAIKNVKNMSNSKEYHKGVTTAGGGDGVFNLAVKPIDEFIPGHGVSPIPNE